MADVQPINQAGILAGGQALVPNYLDQEINRSLGRAQVDQTKVQTDVFRQKLASVALENARQQQYGNDVKLALESGDPRALSQLVAKYPEQKDALKATYDQLDVLEQRSQLQQAAGIWSALNAGNTDVAIKQLEKRITADRTAGEDTADDEEQLALLKSGDPKAINSVKGRLGLFMASVVPEKFAGVVEQLGTGNGEYTLSPGQQRRDGDNNIIAAAPFAPRPVTVGAGDTVIEYQPGGGDQSSGGGGLTVDTVLPVIMQQESGGNYTAKNPETGALGAYQVMPATAQGIAKQLGIPWKPELMANDTPAGRSYQDRIGRAAVKEAIDASGGDPATMAAYYHGGSDQSKWGPRTQQYASEVAGRLGGRGGPRIIAQGQPKQTGHLMTPREIAAVPGLDPGKPYWMDADGKPSAIAGSDKGSLKPWPASALSARSSQTAALTNIDGAIKLLDPKNQSKEAKIARKAIGFGTGWLGDQFTQMNDPEGTDARARIGQIGGLIIKDTSGAAVSLAEDARLAKWVPLVTDSPTVALSKLKNLQREILQRNQAMDETYSEDQGFRPFQSSTQAVSVRSIQEANALPPGTIYRAPDGKLRRR